MPMQAVHRPPHTGFGASSGVHALLVALIAAVSVGLILFVIFLMYAPPHDQKLDKVEAITHRKADVWGMAGDEQGRSTEASQPTADARSNSLVR